MEAQILDGEWQVLEQPLTRIGAAGLKKVKATRAGWLRASVPGEIHLDLIRAGRMPEPLVSRNAAACRWPEKRSWWYRTTFRVTDALRAAERQSLVFDGIDLYGQVFLNGALVGEATNAFVPAVLDVRRKLRRGPNELVVRVTCGAELAPADKQPPPASRKVYGNRNKFDGRVYLRKPQFTYGWDWVDALPNMGIWRSVQLESASDVVVDDVRLDTVIEGRKVWLDTVVTVDNLHPWSERACTVECRITAPDGKVQVHEAGVTASPGLSRVAVRIPVPGAKLWWPNGMGDQPLYDVAVQVRRDGRVTDCRGLRIGLRTIDIDRAALPRGGSRFCIRVNGQDVFCRGGNWVPADAILARVSRERYEHLVGEARNANMNMLRVWGGGIYEDPAFYEACDRAGILVWQDFMFACAQYPDDRAEFRLQVRHEAECVVRALRHHPCIALWSGNNENNWGFAEWWNGARLAAGEAPAIGGAYTYNHILPDVCATLDPARPYWPGSPMGGELPNSETDGDCHWWNQGTMNKDMERRINDRIYDECRARFVSEYGVIGPCSLASTRQFLAPDECHVNSKAWQEHTNTFEKATIPAAIRRHYAEPDGLDVERYIRYGQMFQAVLYGRSIEALRFRKLDPVDDCAGALIWMFNDCWGEHGWTPIDYYLRRKPSYYWIRNACEPVKAIVRRRGDALVTRVVNDSQQSVTATVHYGWVRVDGTESRLRTKAFVVRSNRMRELARERIPASDALDLTEWIYTVFFGGALADAAPSVWQGVPHRELKTVQPTITVTVKDEELTLRSDMYAHGVHVDDAGQGVLSDNYFDLLPGVPKALRIEKPKVRCRLEFRAV